MNARRIAKRITAENQRLAEATGIIQEFIDITDYAELPRQHERAMAFLRGDDPAGADGTDDGDLESQWSQTPYDESR